MSIEDRYENSIISRWFLDENDRPYAKLMVEQQQVSSDKNLVQLTGTPETYQGVTIVDGDNMMEVDNLDDVYKSENNYYITKDGLIYFHPNLKGRTLEFRYNSLGVTLLSTNRIFYKNKDNVVRILQDLIDKGYEGLRALELFGDSATILKRLEKDIETGTILHENLLEDIRVGTPLNTNLKENIQEGGTLLPNLVDANNTATEKKKDLDQSIASATDTNTTLSNTNQSATQTNLVLQQTIASGKDSVDKINATGNKSLIIGASQFVNNEYTWTHNMNSKELHVVMYDSVLDELLFPDCKIIDKNNILIRNSAEHPNIKVVLSASYYGGNIAIGTTMEEFAGDSIPVEIKKVRLKDEITKTYQVPITNSDSVFMMDGATRLSEKINDIDLLLVDLDEISKKVFYTDRYNFDKTGNVDISDSLNNLIIQVNSSGGGVIQFSSGRYRLNKQIRMLPNVILRGDQKWRGLGRQGYTVLQCYNKTDVQILLKQNMRIENFYIEYPEQVDSDALEPIEYNWTISGTEGNINDDIQINNIFLKNSYKGINCNGFGRANITHIYGQPIKTGLRVDNIKDMVDFERIEFWTFDNYNVGSNMFNWIQNNGTAFEFGSVDGGKFSNLFAYGYNKGFYFNGDTWGTFYICTADKCKTPMYVEKCNIVQFIGGTLIGSNKNKAIVEVLAISDTLSFNDVNLFGGMSVGIINKSNTGKLKINCSFGQGENKIKIPLINNGSCPVFVTTNEEKLKIFGATNTFVNGVKLCSNLLGVETPIRTSDVALINSGEIKVLANGFNLNLGKEVEGEKKVGFTCNLNTRGITPGLYLLKFDLHSSDTTGRKRLELTIRNDSNFYNNILWDYVTMENNTNIKIPLYIGKIDSNTMLNFVASYYDESIATNDFCKIEYIILQKINNATYSTLDYLYNNTYSVQEKANYSLI